ncbi:transporter protein [Arthrobacter sp. Hiyo8]|nr:transporter protein [Arthrobacter sp. Hiyo8]
MTANTNAAQVQHERLTGRQTRKVVTAGCVGIFVELYDNGIFAFMAGTLALVFLAPVTRTTPCCSSSPATPSRSSSGPSARLFAATWATGSAGKSYWSSSFC